MPWWAHRMAVEGLSWEKPYLPAQVEMVEGVDRSDPAPAVPDVPVVGDKLTDPGVFVGVRPEEVLR